ncbi:MAG TPA: T9SS type A sorting domain-containing protein [Flavobacteriaceae bacterium]|nr:T9SS type A sorting domain-containing protein [Flavobacteriaceae bacterium]MCB9213317.1 T9SS type A sorting domain-containing protein [Alteromonas sp.]HPF10207.1 T9SS type A sorting domain-containing protein [Flavobacteriaceae bacterium]HQU20653.1 T9SS type A sorting domain-containing protein [Flavobacteriaceae bacterium]HQU64929.1 T9SS type A sorting domain-containing protein [Flavobacteriaceae bacterium]
MKTHLLSCALLFVVTFCYSQFSENFENGIPGSMTQEYLIGVNDWFNCLWGVTNGGIDRSGGVCPINGDYSASFYNFEFGSASALRTPLLDLSAGPYRLEFTHAQKEFGPINQNTLMVEISTDHGDTWQTVVDFQGTVDVPTNRDFNLSSFNTTSETYIRFVATNNIGYAVIVDDIKVKPILDHDIKLLSIDTPYLSTDSTVPISGTIKNYGLNAITSFDVSWRAESNGIIFTSTIDGINIAPGETYSFVHDIPYSTQPGLEILKVTVSNLNGLDQDMDVANNYLDTKINIASTVVNRQKVLFEEFTSSTCGPCYGFNTNIFNEDFLTSNEGKYTLIKYQMFWPGNGDDYYTEEGGERRAYYGVFGIPNLFADSNYIPISITVPELQERLDDALEEPAYFAIASSYGIYLDGMVEIDIEITPYIGDTFRVLAAVIEKETTGNVANNGETEFNNVMMKMVPDAQGTLVTFQPDMPVSLHFDVDMTNTFVEEMSDLEVVIFIQSLNNITREVMQSEMATLEFLETDEFQSDEFMLVPNPAKDFFSVILPETADITVFDLLGNQVARFKAVTANSQLDISKLPAGAYLVEAKANSAIAYQKLVID